MPNFPDRGHEIIRALYQLRPELAAGTEADQRLLTRLIAEQCAFELGPQWGVKSASPTRPQGPSELAWIEPPLWIWRWSDGDGHVTGVKGGPLPAPLLMPLEQSQGQFFIAVDPIDHLHVSDTRPPPRPDPPPTPVPSVDLTPLLARLDLLERAMKTVTGQLIAHREAIAHAVPQPLPRYVSTKFGFTIVSVPEGS